VDELSISSACSRARRQLPVGGYGPIWTGCRRPLAPKDVLVGSGGRLTVMTQDRAPVHGPMTTASAVRLPRQPIYSGLRRYSLAARVHFDAFRFAPLTYLQAVLWRMRGLKVRSRHRLAALMGRSPRAYPLWIARIEPELGEALLAGAPETSASIVPVIDCVSDGDRTSETIRSMRRAFPSAKPVIVAGDRRFEGTQPVRAPSQLADLVAPEGSWLCVVRAGDGLAPRALQIYAGAVLRSPQRWVIYADDDQIQDGQRSAPHFKSEWNADLFQHHDFVSHSALIRVLPEMVRDLPNRDWTEVLTKRAIARGVPMHLAAVLHHRVSRPRPEVPRKPATLLESDCPLCSVIIPTRNGLELLKPCVEGVRRTAYPKIQVIIVDNGSDDPGTLDYLDRLRRDAVAVIEAPGPFNFSALNNAAVPHALGTMLCFLNNDVEIVDPDWLSLLVRQAIRPDIGAVGARLLYPDLSVQHAGVVTGVGGGAAHAHRLQREDEPGYFLRHRLPQRVSAVTAACLVVTKEKFIAVGGFNEVDFPVAFNDVDLCLKLNERGWQSFYEPRAVLIHHESKSRGSDRAKINRKRFAGELAALKRRWGTDRLRDPYHHPQLSPFSEQFFIAV
jgi:GT2 family glycosyltransferase